MGALNPTVALMHVTFSSTTTTKTHKSRDTWIIPVVMHNMLLRLTDEQHHRHPPALAGVNRCLLLPQKAI